MLEKSQTINVMAMQSEKILQTKKSHPNKPRVLLTAFTGKASSLIGKLKKNWPHFLYENISIFVFRWYNPAQFFQVTTVWKTQ